MSVHATLGFLPDEKLFREERPYCLKFEAPKGLRRTNIQAEHRRQIIEDIRGREKDFNLDKNGFALVPFHTKMAYEDFENEDKIVTVYMTEVAAVIQQLVGAFRVQIFEYIRKQHQTFPIATGEAYEHNQPTTMVHIDISKDWARRLAEGLNHKIDMHDLPSQNYRFYNLWRPIRGPVKDWPLALCDNSNLNVHEIEIGDVVFEDFTINNEYIRFSPEQKWHYVSDQQASEAWVFVQGDAKPHTRHGISTSMTVVVFGLHARKGVPHSSFQLRGNNNDHVPRETIEIRALAYFEDDSQPL
ncbi:hypothetical protein BGW36DRAFT_423624 [Talaromyces proteolyticus]|uniref:Uncharacterized protein n=1 Tax=Talaromyces proteolyticus TaxID=1131652 RepID=A0AAD4L4K3_9EURO|nr:uncharacterized protein BGW36DRAFT_423624 [Talaromyces proteolyticus]KAH8704098.1 hypothetical protein BGW36DRAFT_423624 [Talaromyces proteolyticus]